MQNTQRLSDKKANPRASLYVLRKDLGFWQLTFAGQSAVFQHEQGAYYVASLLLNPPAQPIHGLALALKAAALYGQPTAPLQIVDPVTGQPRFLDPDTPLQQRSLGLDDAEAACALRQKQLQLEAILDDPDQFEPVKEEALRELQAIYHFQKTAAKPTRDTAQRAVRSVTMALKRFHNHLATALNALGTPHPVLRPFAHHLMLHLLLPSGRCCARGGPRPAAPLAGSFIYQPPAGVHWEC